jgi:Uma2 family endonuclease
MSTQPRRFYTPDEYLALELASAYKSEYFQGEIFAMSGGSPAHSLLAGQFITQLNNALADRDCYVFTSDTKVTSGDRRMISYPDATVVCGEPRYAEQRQILLNPILIAEVLSPSTEAYDRSRKFEAYQTIPSLQEYVLVAQDRAHVDCFLRQQDGSWSLTSADGRESTITLRSLGVSIPLTELYRRVTFDPATFAGDAEVVPS